MTWDGLASRQLKENIKVEFRRRASVLMPFDQACDQVAQEIYEQHPNLYLALSGGCDSENIANVLVRNKIPFKPIILVYDHVSHKDQQIESWFAFQWCRQHQIEPLIVKSRDYIGSPEEKKFFLSVKPRLQFGHITTGLLHQTVDQLDGRLITGVQLEYYPDYEQMTYLEPQLGTYQGFVLEETDYYIESLSSKKHPWAFHYWTPDVMAAFVNEWNTDLTMQENKARIYKVPPRPKMGYPLDMLPADAYSFRSKMSKNFGTRDCALMGTKQELLSQLVK